MLTQEELKGVAVMTDCGQLVWKKREGSSWQDKRFNRKYAGALLGTVHHTGYKVCTIKGKQYGLHRLVWLYDKGMLPNVIDHIDQDKLNNNIDNLRSVDTATNGRNRLVGKNNKSGVMGVHYCKSRNKWKAQIKFNMKQMTIGYFNDFFNAVCARKSKELMLGFHKNHGNTKASA